MASWDTLGETARADHRPVDAAEGKQGLPIPARQSSALFNFETIMAKLQALSRQDADDGPVVPPSSASPSTIQPTWVTGPQRPAATPRRVQSLSGASYLDYQLTKAREVQSMLTPTELEQRVGVDMAVCYRPATWIGGDYCNVWGVEDGRLAFAVGDVAGKGLPAGLVMSNLHGTLRSTMHYCHDLPAVMAHVNEHLAAGLPESMFVTLFLGMFDASRGELSFVNAGHLPPFLASAGKKVKLLAEPTNLPIGIMEGTFAAGTARLPVGSAVLLVTDGVTEALAPDGEQFGAPRVVDLLDKASFSSARDLVYSLVDQVGTFRTSQPQQDDLTVFAMLHRGRPAVRPTGQWWADTADAPSSRGKQSIRLRSS